MPAFGTTLIGSRDWRERAHVLAHVVRAGRAVHAQHVDRERVERRDGCLRLGAQQQGVDVLLDGELDHQRHAGPRSTNTSFAAATAALTWSRSKQVSTRMASLPPSSSPRTCRR
jgi:hypothetical protein